MKTLVRGAAARPAERGVLVVTGSPEAEVIEKVARALTSWSMVEVGDRVVVGVSGGPDSVALLFVLHELAPRFGYDLVVAHLNHMLRGREAEEDARFVSGLAERLGVACVVGAVDVRAAVRGEPQGAPYDLRGFSLEEAARTVRLDFLARVARERTARRIALGHTRDDQAETVLMRFIRGAGPAGLAGIPPVRPLESRQAGRPVGTDGGTTVIRPLLGVTRVQVEAYLASLGVVARVDSSNLCPDFLRNRLRLELIPLIQRDYNPAFPTAVVRTAELVREDDDYMEHEARKAFLRCAELSRSGRAGRRCVAPAPGGGDRDQDRTAPRPGAPCVLSARELGRMHPALARRVVRLAVDRVSGLKDVELGHIDAVLELARSKSGGERRLDLPGDCEVVRVYSDLVFRPRHAERGAEPASLRVALAVGGRTDLPALGISMLTGVVVPASRDDVEQLVARARSSRGRLAVLDLDSTGPDLWVRTRVAGDSFWPLGAPGPRKLKEFFIDRKIPASLRPHVPLVECATGIAWVVGHEVGQPYRVTPTTANALVIEVISHHQPRST